MGANMTCDGVACEQVNVEEKLEEIRAKMAHYKQHYYDAGGCLPEWTEYELCPSYMAKSAAYQAQAGQWMLNYKVLELYKKTLDNMTFSNIRLEQGVYTTCMNILVCLHNTASFSKIIVERMYKLEYIQFFVKMLSYRQFLENQRGERTEKVLDLVLGSLDYCVIHFPVHLVYNESKLTKVVKPYLVSDNLKLRATAMMIYSSVIGEDEIKQLDGSDCIPFLIRGIRASFETNGRCYYVDDTAFAMHGLLRCVTRMAANDDNKIKMVEAGLLPLIVKSLNTGEDDELEVSATLSWTLCFHGDTKKKVVNEPGMVSILETLSNSKNGGVQKAAKGAMWKISAEELHQKKAEEKHQTKAKEQTSQVIPDKKKHIFISYQWDDQPMVVKLNEKLKADGYKTWIDVEQIKGSTLDAMASAVENAALVLICASEKYKLSANCRTEGEYTYTQRKALVPLMMQRGYRADGWLGMLMGAKLYCNFDGKYEFDQAYEKLINEIKPMFKVASKSDINPADGVAKAPQVTSASQSSFPAPQHNTPTPQLTASQSVATWTNQDVMKWATEHNLTQFNSEFDAMLEKLDGKKLRSLCETKKEAPEFFYKKIGEDYKLDMMVISSLQDAFKDLE